MLAHPEEPKVSRDETRRRERNATDEIRALEQRLRELDEEQHRVAKAIEDEYRREHFGHSPGLVAARTRPGVHFIKGEPDAEDRDQDHADPPGGARGGMV